MKRKMTLTITGEDDNQQVGVAIDFDPPITNSDANEESGFAKAVGIVCGALERMGEVAGK